MVGCVTSYATVALVSVMRLLPLTHPLLLVHAATYCSSQVTYITVVVCKQTHCTGGLVLDQCTAVSFYKHVRVSFIYSEILFCFSLFTCSPDMKDKMASDGSTPLHIAVIYNHVAILEVLISAGANILALNLKMQTPLKLAAESKRLECYRILDATITKLESQSSQHVQKLQSKAYDELKKKVKETEKRGQRHASISSVPIDGSAVEAPRFEETVLRAGKSLPYRARRHTDQAVHGMAERMQELASKAQGQHTYGTFQLRTASSEEEIQRRGSDGFSTSDETVERGRKSVPQVFPEKEKMIDALYSIQMPKALPRTGSDEFYGQRHVSGRSSDSESPYAPGSAVSGPLDSEYDPYTLGKMSQPILTENDSPLATFLQAYDLGDTMQDLVREKMDLESLLMCAETDLQRAGIALGPTKKIMAAVQERKARLSNPGKMHDMQV